MCGQAALGSATLTLANALFLCRGVSICRCARVRSGPAASLGFRGPRRLRRLLRTLPRLLFCLSALLLLGLLRTRFGLGTLLLCLLLLALLYLRFRLGALLLLGLLRARLSLGTLLLDLLLLALLRLRFRLCALLLLGLLCMHLGL